MRKIKNSRMINKKTISAVLSPVLVIAVGLYCAVKASRFLAEWAFIPLALVYWLLLFICSYVHFGKSLFARLFSKPKKGVLWPVLCLLAGLIPLPVFLLNLKLFTAPLVVVLWLVFAAVNPFFEEVYWRGYLLDALPFPKPLSVIYSSVLFVAAHPLMWGVFSIANRSWMTWASLTLMGVVWSITYLKTTSLRWCVISHILVYFSICPCLCS